MIQPIDSAHKFEQVTHRMKTSASAESLHAYYLFSPEQRAILRLSGEDRYDFLNGLVTKEISPTSLADGRQIKALFLTAQGRFVQEILVSLVDNALWMETDGGTAADFRQELLRYKLRAKISLELLTDWRVALGENGERKFVPPEFVADFAAISDAKIWEKCELARICATHPDGSRDLRRQESQVLEFNYDVLQSPAIDWNKGCYLGQEIVARIHYRGLLKYRLFTVEFMGLAENAARPDFGTAIFDQSGKEIGSLCSRMGNYALAHLRLDAVKIALENKENLRCGNLVLAVQPPRDFSLS
ncbi:MAG: hypothetical protein ORN98_06705 [Alphaproteobacteria bacterium]|nr:hypothetical protein [Alphaproteobacteria bacterium]